ncbi:zinc finger CCCH domain-containing protein 15-like [Vicia villosa]|uniref:zinc finger CCCH domain-containing protein 15-like n=1 Tax=Vicia villosa TaxID=3911 RepID=UPI00273BB586|nr:zinc finger CCCH domain-containing protein 15-like [Vicia villosa]
MYNKEVCSPLSQSRFGVGINTAGHMQLDAGAFASLYSALTNSSENLPSLSGNYNNGGGVSLYPYSDSETEYDSFVIQKHQDMVNRHSMCLSRLMEASNEVKALQQENEELRALSKELQKNLNLLVQASLENRFGRGGSSVPTLSIPFDVLHSARGLNLGDGKENCAGYNNNNINNNNKELQEDSDESSESVIDDNDVDDEAERFSLPKSISVRSKGYVKMAQPPAVVTNNNACRSTKGATRSRASSTQPDQAQKVYVQGGQKEEEPLEMTVYNQGMLKTELCNKWQETGTCPYTDHCQFAHGIEELRPVIRHPRYKTEVCRMVFAGVVCPYGHRCHFRHALTEEEKAISQSMPKSVKLER